MSNLSAPPSAVVRTRRVKARQRRITWWMALASGAFIVALVALSWVGYKASLRVGGGTAERVTDPKAPGYIATPRPSTVDLYVVTDNAGGFATALLSVPDPSGKGGSMVPLSASFMLPEHEGAPPMFLADAFKNGGIEGIRQRLAIALNARIGSAETVPPAAVAAVAGATPVVVVNPDNLTSRSADGATKVVYPAGKLSLAPDKVVDYLAFEGADDPAPNQALRAQAVWQELLTRAKTTDLQSLPTGQTAEGSTSPGFGPALAALVAGKYRFDLVPMAKVQVPNSYFVGWLPDPAALNGFVAGVIPLPQAPVPGSRTQVQVLNGTHSAAAIPAVLPLVVGQGAEVTQIGNAESFSVPTSRVEYSNDTAKAAAEKLAGALGVTAARISKPLDGASVRVVVGEDRAK